MWPAPWWNTQMMFAVAVSSYLLVVLPSRPEVLPAVLGAVVVLFPIAAATAGQPEPIALDKRTPWYECDGAMRGF